MDKGMLREWLSHLDALILKGLQLLAKVAVLGLQYLMLAVGMLLRLLSHGSEVLDMALHLLPILHKSIHFSPQTVNLVLHVYTASGSSFFLCLKLLLYSLLHHPFYLNFKSSIV